MQVGRERVLACVLEGEVLSGEGVVRGRRSQRIHPQAQGTSPPGLPRVPRPTCCMPPRFRRTLVPPGIVEAWARGTPWTDIMAGVDLDDGDMARLLARTVDVLRQVLFLEHLLPYVVGPARDAVRAMDRSPISDLAV